MEKKSLKRISKMKMLMLDEIFLKAKLGEDEYETAAIITMTEAEAFTLYQMLKARGEEVHYIDRNSSAFKKGLPSQPFILRKDWNSIRYSESSGILKIRCRTRQNISVQREHCMNYICIR